MNGTITAQAGEERVRTMDELWGRCPKCLEWFEVEDPTLEAHFLCPTCLVAAYRTQWRASGRKRHRGSG